MDPRTAATNLKLLYYAWSTRHERFRAPLNELASTSLMIKGGAVSRPPFFTPRLGGVFHCSFFLGVGENSRQIGLGRRCHEASRHVVDADRNRVSSRRSATSGKLDDPDRHPTSLLYGNLTSTSAILKMDSNGCVWTSWCLLFILSLRSCSIEKHSSCRTSRIF